MATRTENLGLVKPGLEDDADIRVINANMDILDKQIGEVNSVQKYKASWFDSVASMKAEPSLTAGTYVCTAGYYAPNDGGGASYLIRAKADTDVDDGGSLHKLSNGLVAELIIENGTVCPEQFGAKGDANYFNSNDGKYYVDAEYTTESHDDKYAFQQALNSESLICVLKANTNYRISSRVEITNGGVGLLIGGDNTVIKGGNNGTEVNDVFRITKPIEMANIVFDFENGDVRNGIYVNFANEYKDNYVNLHNLVFKNIKDMNDTYGTTCIYVHNTDFIIRDITIKNLKKQGNGIIGDYGGGWNGILVQGDSDIIQVQGTIENVYIEETHNVDSSETLMFEDGSGVIVQRDDEYAKNPIIIRNIKGYNFGKRLVKLQSGNIQCYNCSGISNINDVMCLLYCDKGNVIFDGFQFEGLCAFPVAVDGSNCIVTNGIINSSGQSWGNYSGGILLGASASNCIINNVKIDSANFCIIFPETTTAIENIKISNCILSLKADGYSGGCILMRNAKRVTIENVDLVSYRSESNYSALTLSTNLSNIKICNVNLYYPASMGMGVIRRETGYTDILEDIILTNINVLLAVEDGSYSDPIYLEYINRLNVNNIYLNGPSNNVVRVDNCNNVIVDNLIGHNVTFVFVPQYCDNVTIKNVEDCYINSTNTNVKNVQTAIMDNISYGDNKKPGALWYDTTNNLLKVKTDTGWKTVMTS